MSRASSTHRVGPPMRQPSTRAWVTVCSFAIPERMPEWESREAIRRVNIRRDSEIWTLEGDSAIFDAEPQRNQQLDLSIVARPPGSALRGKLFVHVWLNRARAAIVESQEVGEDGRVTVFTYPEVVTSLKFRDEQGRWEAIERHLVKGRRDSWNQSSVTLSWNVPLCSSSNRRPRSSKIPPSTSAVREHMPKTVTFISPCTRREPLACA